MSGVVMQVSGINVGTAIRIGETFHLARLYDIKGFYFYIHHGLQRSDLER
jgi:hypothetical protein